MMKNSSNHGFSSAKNSDKDVTLDDDYDADVQEEESGWTGYFDDFFSSKNDSQLTSKGIEYSDGDEDDDGGCHGSGGSICSLEKNPSMVSDAASCTAWKTQFDNGDGKRSTVAATLAACSSFDGTQMVIHKKLRFKTANRHGKRCNDYDDSLEDTASSPVNSPKAKSDFNRYDNLQQVEEAAKGYEDATGDLRKRGLCLVPYSMLINYIN